MPSVTDSQVFDAYLTSTQSHRLGTIHDQVFDKTPTASWMNGKMGMALRGSTIKTPLSSGNRIEVPIMFGKNNTSGWYSRSEELDTTKQDGATMAIYPWTQHSVSITMDGLETNTNMGEHQIVNLTTFKTDQAIQSAREDFSIAIFGDGTANNGKQMTGLQVLVDDSATAGGLDPAIHTTWRSTDITSGSFSSQGLADMNNAFNTVTRQSGPPDFITTTQEIYQFFENTLQPQVRYGDKRVMNSGFVSLLFKQVPLVFDRDCTAGFMYMLNSGGLRLYVHPNVDFKMSPFQTPVGRDVSVAMILWLGNLVVTERRAHAVIKGMTQ